MHRALWTAILVVLSTWASAQNEMSPPGETTSNTTTSRSISRTIVFPVLVQAPLFGASVTLPSIDVPSGGGGSGSERPTGTTDTSLNSAWFAGLRIDREKWMLEANGLYAGLSSERTLPRVTIDNRVVGGTATFGWRLGQDWFVTGGVRRMGLKIDASVQGFDPVERRPGIWDPLVGVMWSRRVGRNWTLEAEAQGGGFGVGTDADLSGSFNVDWRFADHFGLRLGYSILHFKLSDTVLGKNLETSQTMQGPAFGLGVYFGKR